MNFRAFISGAFLFSVCASSFGATVTLRLGSVQVYFDAKASSVTRFAAGELGKMLSQSFGSEVPVTNKFLDSHYAIVVGDNHLSREAGINVDKLPRDAGVIKITERMAFIAGCDDEKKSEKEVEGAFRAGIWGNMYERASEFAVYEFLERFVGVRFYFPGRLGTIVPAHTELQLPVIEIVNNPDYTYRDYAAWEMGAWFDDVHRKNGRQIMHHRHRLLTEFIPCSHGLNEFHYLKRFGKTHPEYFQVLPNGKRNVDPKYPQPGQLCHTSKIWDEIYADAKSFLIGESAAVRGIPAGYPPGRGEFGWNCNTKNIKGMGKFVDVMPQDAFQMCHCQACQKEYREDKNNSSYASELVWGKVINLCKRLKAEGIEGTVTMMGYTPYKNPPAMEFPDNLMVMVARGGPWSEANPPAAAREKAEIKAWAEKTGKKVWLWNYPCKFRGEFPAIPEHCPRAWAKYYKDLSPWIFGAFAQNTTTRWMYGHLNTYVYSKVCWDNDVDVDALLEEYYTLMYGKGREEMKRFFEALEKIWIGKVVGQMIDTPLGPVPSPPSDYELFNSIFSPARIAALKSCLDKALVKVGDKSLEAERIELMRKEYFNPLSERARKYLDSTDLKRGLERRSEKETMPNIIPNPTFDSDIDGWKGKGEIDTTCKVRGSGSVKIVIDNPKGGGIYRMLNKGKERLKPNTKYRLSYFVRFENVMPTMKGGGVYSNVWTEGQNWYPTHPFGHTGSADWIYQEQTFVSREEKGLYGGYDNCSISLCLLNATGTVWFDDVRLEEVK
jgi:hypothetical protein